MDKIFSVNVLYKPLIKDIAEVVHDETCVGMGLIKNPHDTYF